MQPLMSALRLLRRGIILFVCLSLFNVVTWFSFPAAPGYAVSSPKEALQEIQRDQATQDPKQAYEKAAEITEDPKMGVEKAYEQSIDEYYKENPEDTGLIEGAKELLNKVTGND